MNFGLKRCAAYQTTSASTRRPSASVLMISMVWPDIDVTMSPGRCALPSGMFSTRPMRPTALTLALRAASACIRPATQAAPAMSPFMSSMLAAALIEMPPVSKQTPLPMKATGASPFLPPFQRITTTRLLARRALADAEQRVHAELLHRLDVEHLDVDAGLLQHGHAAGEFFRIEDVGRLVDEIARHQHAAVDGLARRIGASHRGRVADGDRHRALVGRLVLVLALGLVAVERHRRAAACPAPGRPTARHPWRRRAIRQRWSPPRPPSAPCPSRRRRA